MKDTLEGSRLQPISVKDEDSSTKDAPKGSSGSLKAEARRLHSTSNNEHRIIRNHHEDDQHPHHHSASQHTTPTEYSTFTMKT
jgi:hypothetical protein